MKLFLFILNVKGDQDTILKVWTLYQSHERKLLKEKIEKTGPTFSVEDAWSCPSFPTGLPKPSMTFFSAFPADITNLALLHRRKRINYIIFFLHVVYWPLPFLLGGWCKGEDPRDPPNTSSSAAASFNAGQLALSLATCASNGFKAKAAKSFELGTNELSVNKTRVRYQKTSIMDKKTRIWKFFLQGIL